MKPALLTFSLLLLAFIAKPSLCNAEPVLEINGDPLVPGSEYYVLPFLSALGGGLRLAKIGNSNCPVDIVQEPRDHWGQTLLFTPLPKIGLILTDTPLSVSFAKTPNCAPKSSKWILQLNSTSEPSFVRIGVEPPIFQEAFEIKRIEEIGFPTYKFVYNARISHIQGTFDIGTKLDEHRNSRLAAIINTDDSIQPFLVVFRKASYEKAEIRMKTA